MILNLVKWVAWCCGVILFFATCERTQHSKIKKAKDGLVECIGSPLDPKEEAVLRKRINAEIKIRAIEEIFRKKRLAGFNGNVLIAQKGVVLYEHSFGYADLKKKDSLQSLHAFQLASLSKPFTAIAILQLIEAKKINLDDSIQKFLPEFPYHGIFIKSLLSHRSGLPNYAYSFPDSVRHGRKYPSNGDLLNWFVHASPLPARYNYPNRSFNYCNTNYLVLASIVEKVSGVSFEYYLRKNIFEPLGMDHTFVNTTPPPDSSNCLITRGHQYGRMVPKDYFDDVVGDKGVYSTTEDLYRFYKGLIGKCLLKEKTLHEAFTPRSFERRGIKNYGYGFRMHLDEEDKPKYIYHTGWWKGYNTIMWISEKDDFVIIILSNSYNRSVYRIKELLDVLHGTVQSDDVEKDI